MIALVKRLSVSVSNMFGRGILSRTDDTKQMQLVQLEVLAGEVRDHVEHPEEYGFTSNPVAGAEVFVACVGGRREHPIALKVADRRYRLTGLPIGEVAVYSKFGSKIVLKASGDIEITTTGAVKVNGGSASVAKVGSSVQCGPFSGLVLDGSSALKVP